MRRAVKHPASNPHCRRDFKVFILDYNDLAIEIDLSPCRVEDNVVVEMATGTVFPQAHQHSPDSPDYDAAAHAHHQFGTHAAPWLMLKVSAHPSHVMQCRGMCAVNLLHVSGSQASGRGSQHAT